MNTTEPQHFRSKEGAENYIKDTTRQFNWLLEKYKKCQGEEEKKKARAKLTNFCASHPSFTKALIMFFEKNKEG